MCLTLCSAPNRCGADTALSTTTTATSTLDFARHRRPATTQPIRDHRDTQPRLKHRVDPRPLIKTQTLCHTRTLHRFVCPLFAGHHGRLVATIDGGCPSWHPHTTLKREEPLYLALGEVVAKCLLNRYLWRNANATVTVEHHPRD